MILLGVKVLEGYIEPNGIENQNIVKHANSIGIKTCEFLITYTQMVYEKGWCDSNTHRNLRSPLVQVLFHNILNCSTNKLWTSIRAWVVCTLQWLMMTVFDDLKVTQIPFSHEKWIGWALTSAHLASHWPTVTSVAHLRTPPHNISLDTTSFLLTISSYDYNLKGFVSLVPIQPTITTTKMRLVVYTRFPHQYLTYCKCHMYAYIEFNFDNKKEHVY